MPGSHIFLSSHDQSSPNKTKNKILSSCFSLGDSLNLFCFLYTIFDKIEKIITILFNLLLVYACFTCIKAWTKYIFKKWSICCSVPLFINKKLNFYPILFPTLCVAFYIHNYIHSFLFIQPIYHNILKNEDCTLRNLKNKGFSKLILTLTEIWPVSRDVCKVCHIIFDFKYPFLGIVWLVQDYCW